MAVMFPEDAHYHRPESHAERRLYPVLARLPDDYTVYCNRRWHTPPRAGRAAQPAEADFLVAHPDRGILVVEVKGGRVRYDPRTDCWFSNDQRLKQSPFAQVQRTRYRLRDMLEGSGAREVEFPLAEAVALPDVDLSPRDLPPGEVPERVIDAGDLEKIEPAVVRAFEAFGLEGKGAVFGRRGVRALTSTIAGSVDLRRSLGSQVAESEAEFIRLTENQYEVLDALDGNMRVLVTGGAGTGKTLLAVEEARRLANQGLRVLVTCFNQPLGVHLAGVLRDEARVEALHFHGICTRWAKEAGLAHERSSDESPRDYYDIRAPNLLSEAAAALRREVDAVVVDEAQDFLPEWLDALELLIGDDQGVMFLFADENQTIYRGVLSAPRNFLRYRLTSNLRNTGKIHQLLVRHFGEHSTSKGPDGVDVTLRTCRSEREIREVVSALLTRLRAHDVPADAITVLSGRSAAGSRLGEDGGRIGAFRLCSNPKGPNDIRLASVHRFKGLESSVVILCEMEDVRPPSARSLWYTAISRARSALVLVVSDPDGSLAELPVDDALDILIPEHLSPPGTQGRP